MNKSEFLGLFCTWLRSFDETTFKGAVERINVDENDSFWRWLDDIVIKFASTGLIPVTRRDSVTPEQPAKRAVKKRNKPDPTNGRSILEEWYNNANLQRQQRQPPDQMACDAQSLHDAIQLTEIRDLETAKERINEAADEQSAIGMVVFMKNLRIGCVMIALQHAALEAGLKPDAHLETISPDLASYINDRGRRAKHTARTLKAYSYVAGVVVRWPRLAFVPGVTWNIMKQCYANIRTFLETKATDPNAAAWDKYMTFDDDEIEHYPADD